ncbi:MAG: tetratricopeptide repeat protein, partial [Coriobacteriia bacterium]|nr:tetratricopeptide repeat protein [Coriobacteriia bacterium]
MDPYLAIAYTNLGNICFRQQNDVVAEQMYRRALEIEPKQPEAHYNLGYVMLERGDPGAAVPFFQSAILA